LRYEATLPVAGVFFAPDYGELYYENMAWQHVRAGKTGMVGQLL